MIESAKDSGVDHEVSWFHLHIPKTAGTSLNQMLADAFGDEFQITVFPRTACGPE